MAKPDLESQQPLAIELYAGLHGWGEGLVAEGFRSVGFDIVDMCAELGHARPEGCFLVIQDVTTLHGSQFRDAAVIVASPPCQAYSYRAMPWKRAKALPPPDNTLFEACFRIQREASEAAGRYIPLIVENVRGAQKWVGRAKANFGSYYLWGDVGMVGRRVVAGVPRFGVSVVPVKAFKSSGMNWSNRDLHGQDFTRIAGQQAAQKRNPDGTGHGSGSWFKIADSKNRGAKAPAGNCAPVMWKDRDVQRYAHPTVAEQIIQGFNDSGTNQAGISGERNNGKGDKWFQDGAAKHGSKSNSRKAASAQIAKIPFALAQHVAHCFVASYAERLLEKKVEVNG